MFKKQDLNEASPNLLLIVTRESETKNFFGLEYSSETNGYKIALKITSSNSHSSRFLKFNSQVIHSTVFQKI